MFRNRTTGFFSTIFAWLGLAARAPIAIFAGLFGVAVIAFGCHLGVDSVRLGILRGWETRDWVKADETNIYAATIRWHGIWGLSGYEELYAPYRYKIDGIWHRGKNFSAMGVLIADVETVYEVRDRLGSFDAWYDPENPSVAVLKKGITFDGTTKSALSHIAFGSIVLLTALAYMRNKEKLLRKYSPRFAKDYGDPFRAGE